MDPKQGSVSFSTFVSIVPKESASLCSVSRQSMWSKTSLWAMHVNVVHDRQ